MQIHTCPRAGWPQACAHVYCQALTRIHCAAWQRLKFANEVMEVVKRKSRLRVWGLKVLDNFTDVDPYDKAVLRLQVTPLPQER